MTPKSTNGGWLSLTRASPVPKIPLEAQGKELAATDQVLEITEEPVARVLVEAVALKLGDRLELAGLDDVEGRFRAPLSSATSPR